MSARARFATFAAVVVAAGWLWRRLIVLVVAADRLPQWDMAKYGVSGLRLADAVRRFDPLAWLAEVHALDVWPPLYPLVESLAFLVAGDRYGVPRELATVLFAAAAVAAAWAAWEIERPAGAARAALAAALAAALWLSSPAAQLFGSLTMLEVPAALALFVAVALYARWLASGRLADLRFAAAAATALFFVKFNHGLLWLLPLLLHEAWDEAGGVGALARRLRRRAAGYDWRRPWPIFVALVLALLAALAASGGFSFAVGALAVEAHSVGNPVYALWLVALLRAALWPPARRRWAARWRALPERFRVLARWVALPIGVWMLSPYHVKDFFGFLENRVSRLPLGEQLALYPRAFVDDFSAAAWVGWAVAAAALVPLARLPRLGAARRSVGLALLVAAVALVAHRYKLPRFAFAAAPLVWLAAASAFAEAVDRLSRRLPERWLPPRRRGWPAALVATAVLAAAAVAGVDAGRWQAAFALHSVGPEVRPLLDAVADAAAASERGSLFVGHWNHLSPGLVEWHLHQRHPHRVGRRPLGPEELTGRRDAAAILDRAARLGTVFVVDAERLEPPRGAAWEAESGGLDPLRHALAGDPRFRLERDLFYPAAGYRLRVYGSAVTEQRPR